MDLTPKQQTSEAIRQAETILITTAQRPSIDQISAVIGLSMILRKFGKKVTAVISDSLPPSVQLLDTAQVSKSLGGMRDFVLKLDVTKAEVDKLRYEVKDGKLQIFITPYKGGFAPSDVTFDYGEAQFEYDLAIVLGVPTRVRIDRIYEQNSAMFDTIPVLNLDFHRSNENYGAVNLIDSNASSLCEMMVALAESLQGGIIDADIATALLMGIVGSTDRFTASHTTSKSLTVAAQMMAAGAKQQAVVKALYRGGGERGNDRPERNDRNDRGGERTPAPKQREDRREAQPRPAAHVPVPQPQPVQQSEPVRESQPAREPEMPIIQPAHIELSEVAETPVPSQPVAAPSMPVAPVSAAVAPVAETAPAVPGQIPPLADFAAAAEILGQQQRIREEQGSSEAGEIRPA
ncbi:MAG: exopolyphosphatase-like protein phosphoesterase RecJ protein [Patescibacteria group bacterium]|nr:exopolyphosphatase-like protein phosphoesterase RecJ protein [Patescibacteria group bacterium]